MGHDADGDTAIMNGRPWSKRELAVIRRDYPHEPTMAIAARIGRSLTGVYRAATKLGIKKSAVFNASSESGRLTKLTAGGVTHRFKKGQTPWNAGTKGIVTGGVATQFKKGCRSGQAAKNWMPIGSHRIDQDGYLRRKITDNGYAPKDWEAVHRLVWTQAHGPIPSGHVIVFKPGRATAKLSAITLDAIECVSRQELMRRNSYHNNYPKELAQLIQLRGAVQRQINKRGRDAE